MIAHIVLFRPRADLTPEARQALVAVLQETLSRIPSIRRWRVGPRVLFGHAYEGRVRVDYPYLAVLEFETPAALSAYLEHPAHAELAARFYAAAEDVLACDFELAEGSAGVTPAGGTPLGTAGGQ